VTNPFGGHAGADQGRGYAKPLTGSRRTDLLDARTGARVEDELLIHIHSQFRSMITIGAFPCVLARSAFNRDAYRFGLYEAMDSLDSIAALCADLYEFVEEQPQIDGFSSFIVCFLGPIPRSEQEYEQLLWQLLQRLHEQDHDYFEWDPSTSDDPSNPAFSFSFAGRSFFIVGMHAHSARYSRRFPYPVLVFNAHRQFEQLRSDGEFEKYQRAIRERDIRLQGHINPSLANYGDDSEARQYSGRLVEADWLCPFQPRRRRAGGDTPAES
jgi:FPC/CPF motif-containing protein YcgG